MQTKIGLNALTLQVSDSLDLAFLHRKEEGASFSKFAFQPYFAAIFFHELFAENQSQAGALFVGGTTGGVP